MQVLLTWTGRPLLGISVFSTLCFRHLNLFYHAGSFLAEDLLKELWLLSLRSSNQFLWPEASALRLVRYFMKGNTFLLPGEWLRVLVVSWRCHVLDMVRAAYGGYVLRMFQAFGVYRIILGMRLSHTSCLLSKFL